MSTHADWGLELEALLVEVFLGSEAGDQYRAGKIAQSALAPYVASIQKLSSAYLDESKRPAPSRIETPVDAVAYALYYLPINFRKTLHLLDQVSLPDLPSLSVLDIGAGPGTASLALTAFDRRAMEFTLVDLSKEMRNLAHQLMTRWCSERNLRSFKVEEPLERIFEQHYDVIFVGNLLTELSLSERWGLLSSCAAALSSHGILVLIEPALKAHTHQMMELRDRLISSFYLTPLFPCTHAEACPMRTHDANDWCHGEVRWERPQVVRQLDDLAGFNKHRIKYTAFVFSRSGSVSGGYRVVDMPKRRKGGIELQLCGEKLYRSIMFTRKSRLGRERKLSAIALHDLIPREVLP